MSNIYPTPSPIFPATINTEDASHQNGVITADHSVLIDNEVFLRLWKDTETPMSCGGVVAQANLTPRQLTRLAATLAQMAVEARGYTAWDVRTAEYIGRYHTEAETHADLATWPDGIHNAVVLHATRREVEEAIDSLKYHGKWADPARWFWFAAVMDEVRTLALTGD